MNNSITLLDGFFPNLKKSKVKTFITLFVASWFIALLAQIAVALPFTPVPLTGQTIGVLAVGLAMGGKRAAAAVSLYIAQGAMGLPFFAGGSFGLAILAGTTAGYLIAFIPAAYCVGLCAEKGFDQTILKAFMAMMLGHFVIFLGGWSYLSVLIGAEKAFTLGVLPFLGVMLLKNLIVASVLPTLRRVKSL